MMANGTCQTANYCLESFGHSDCYRRRGSYASCVRSIFDPNVDTVAKSCSWNPERQNVRYSTELKGHSAGIEKVAFNPVKDAELCSVSSDGVVKFWDVRTKAVINEIKGLGDAFTLAWCPDGESLVVGNKVSLFFTL
jgi:WD40 repeat protein